MKTLEQRLDEACERHGLEWVVLPCDYETGVGSAPDAWRNGPYWCALVVEGPRRSGHGRFYAYNGFVVGRENDPNPEVVYIHPGPLGRHEAKKLLLAQL